MISDWWIGADSLHRPFGRAFPSPPPHPPHHSPSKKTEEEEEGE